MLTDKLASSKIIFYFLFFLVVVIPTNGFGFFTGFPLNGKIESIATAFLFPLALVLNKEFFISFFGKRLIMAAIILKLILFFFATPSGVCMEPYWVENENGVRQKVSTYEGFWNNACFVVKNEIMKGRNFPVEHYNRYYEMPDPEIEFRFYFVKPSKAQNLVIDSGGYQIDIAKERSKGITSVNYSNNRAIFSLNDRFSSAGYVDGVIYYKFGNREWRFRPYFTDSEGKEVHDGISSDRFYIDDPHTTDAQILAYKIVAMVMDAIIILFLAIALMAGFIRLHADDWRVTVAVASLLACWFVKDIVMIPMGYHTIAQIPILSSLPGFLPLMITVSLGFALYLVIAVAIPNADKLSAKSVFLLALLATSFYYAPAMIEKIGSFQLWQDGDDWRTYQRFARVIFESNPFLVGEACPPRWNLPFAYFVMFLHIVGGQSIFFQQVLDIYALTLAVVMIYLLGCKWGLSPRLALGGGFLYIYIHFIMGYWQYIGHGLTEHATALIIFSLVLLFSRMSISGRGWLLGMAVLFGFIAIGWRPNFLPWIYLSAISIAGKEEIFNYGKLFGKLWEYRQRIVLFGVLVFSWIPIFMMRNYIDCGQFVYIAPEVKNLYNLSGFLNRFHSVYSMVTTIPRDTSVVRDLASAHIFSVPLLIGWGWAMLAGIIRKGIFLRFPLGLSIFAWIAFLVHFAKFNIDAGYFVRWSIPLTPFWVLGFVFFIDAVIFWMKSKKDEVAQS